MVTLLSAFLRRRMRVAGLALGLSRPRTGVALLAAFLALCPLRGIFRRCVARASGLTRLRIRLSGRLSLSLGGIGLVFGFAGIFPLARHTTALGLPLALTRLLLDAGRPTFLALTGLWLSLVAWVFVRARVGSWFACAIPLGFALVGLLSRIARPLLIALVWLIAWPLVGALGIFLLQGILHLLLQVRIGALVPGTCVLVRSFLVTLLFLARLFFARLFLTGLLFTGLFLTRLLLTRLLLARFLLTRLFLTGLLLARLLLARLLLARLLLARLLLARLFLARLLLARLFLARLFLTGLLLTGLLLARLLLARFLLTGLFLTGLLFPGLLVSRLAFRAVLGAWLLFPLLFLVLMLLVFLLQLLILLLLVLALFFLGPPTVLFLFRLVACRLEDFHLAMFACANLAIERLRVVAGIAGLDPELDLHSWL